MRSNYKSIKRDAPGTSNENESKAGQSSWSRRTRVGKKERGGKGEDQICVIHSVTNVLQPGGIRTGSELAWKYILQVHVLYVVERERGGEGRRNDRQAKELNGRKTHSLMETHPTTTFSRTRRRRVSRALGILLVREMSSGKRVGRRGTG